MRGDRREVIGERRDVRGEVVLLSPEVPAKTRTPHLGCGEKLRPVELDI